MNTDDKTSVLIQTVTIIAVTGVATLSWTDLISVLLNAVTEHAFVQLIHDIIFLGQHNQLFPTAMEYAVNVTNRL